MSLMHGRKDTLDKLFEKFAADPNAQKHNEKGKRKESVGINLPKANKKNEIDQQLLEKERRKQKILK